MSVSSCGLEMNELNELMNWKEKSLKIGLSRSLYSLKSRMRDYPDHNHQEKQLGGDWGGRERGETGSSANLHKTRLLSTITLIIKP